MGGRQEGTSNPTFLAGRERKCTSMDGVSVGAGGVLNTENGMHVSTLFRVWVGHVLDVVHGIHTMVREGRHACVLELGLLVVLTTKERGSPIALGVCGYWKAEPGALHCSAWRLSPGGAL